MKVAAHSALVKGLDEAPVNVIYCVTQAFLGAFVKNELYVYVPFPLKFNYSAPASTSKVS